jgi:hypothetical protein
VTPVKFLLYEPNDLVCCRGLQLRPRWDINTITNAITSATTSATAKPIAALLGRDRSTKPCRKCGRLDAEDDVPTAGGDHNAAVDGFVCTAAVGAAIRARIISIFHHLSCGQAGKDTFAEEIAEAGQLVGRPLERTR